MPSRTRHLEAVSFRHHFAMYLVNTSGKTRTNSRLTSIGFGLTIAVLASDMRESMRQQVANAQPALTPAAA